jgi:intracellular multiplication protein IcmJ
MSREIELRLGVKRGLWRRNDPHAAISSEEFSAIRQVVLSRDGHTCQAQGCGFVSKPKQNSLSTWLEVHHVNDDHADNRPENLVTLCALCHAVFHIGLAGVDNRGCLIMAPHISQADLNHLARTLFMAMLGDEPALRDTARADYDKLLAARNMVEATFGAGMSNPSVLGALLLTLSDEQHAVVSKIFEPEFGLRLLPIPEGYGEKRLTAWAGAYKAIPPSSWARIAEGVEV